MSKKVVFEDFREDGVYDTYEKHKSIEDAIYSGVESMKRMIGLDYKIDYFNVEPDDEAGKTYYHIRVTGDRLGKG